MAIYVCQMCGYEYDEEAEGIEFSNLDEDWTCPICASPKSFFELKGSEDEDESEGEKKSSKESSSGKDSGRKLEKGIIDIQKIADTGKSIDEPMETLQTVPNFDDIVFLGAQLCKIPLNDDAFVNTETVIGKKAKKPLIINSPVYISHMSFGALSKRAKIALAKGSNIANTAICSGEGGILPEEKAAAGKYIFEYVPNQYSVNDENLKGSDAIEIKIGQGTKPGLGGHLPGEKVTEEIAKIRNMPVGKDIVSPSHFSDIKCPEDLENLIQELRKRSDGRPIGVKISAGHIEKDLEFIAKTTADFVTIDGRGGATGSSPKELKNSSSVPTVFALSRAAKYIRENNIEIDLVITGGFRTSSDFAKALAMGADAVAIASAAIIALGCERYRICHTGRCPTGIATQDETLSSRINIEDGARKVSNFLNVSTEELRMFARSNGVDDVHKLSTDDLQTTSMEISEFTDIKHV